LSFREDALSWVRLPLGRLRVHVSVWVAGMALALFAAGRDLWARYLLLVATLLVHELAHAAASLALGGRRADVRIWPVFGRADVETPAGSRTVVVALAAPAANLLVAGTLFLLGARLTARLATAPLLDVFLTAHFLMGVVNLIPVPPIDGGRALAALRRESCKE